MANPTIAIIGGGIVGCATAYYLAQAGILATVFERATPGAEASGVNAGFVGCLPGVESDTLDFLRPSVALVWQAIDELDEEFEAVRGGRLMLALAEPDLARLQQLHARSQAAGLPLELLDGPAARACVPGLSEAVLGAVFLATDGQVEPAKLTRAYATTAQRLGARFEIGVEVSGLEQRGGRLAGLRTSAGLREFDGVVLAAGAWSAALAASVGLDLPVRPGHGQMLATQPLPPLTERVVMGPGSGLAQRRGGEVVIGSEVEYLGFVKQVNPATIAAHLERGATFLPALREARIARTWSGLRPMTPDSLPIVGPAPGIDGLWLTTGHSRTGMGYGPGTGRAIADLIARGETAFPLARFSLSRFAPG